MSTCSRTTLRLSRSLSKTSVSSRRLSSLGSHGDWSSKPSHDAIISSSTWNAASASMKIRSKESSAEKTDLLLDSILSRSFPLPHVNHGTLMNYDLTNLTFSNSMPSIILNPVEHNEAIQLMNRNARRPKKANRGSRPCSRAARRKKKDAIGKRRR